MGGHNVPEDDVRRRFSRSIKNFLNHYRLLADSWILFDNTNNSPLIIASQKQGEIRIIEESTYDLLMRNYGDR